MIKRNIIVEKFPINYSFAEDLLFFANNFKNFKKINLITDYLYNYRVGNMDSLVHQFDKSDFSIFEKTINIYLKYFSEKEIVYQLYSFYLHYLIRKVNTFFENKILNDEERKKLIIQLLDNELIKKIPLYNFHLTPKENRIASTLIIGDIEMIIEEFKKINN